LEKNVKYLGDSDLSGSLAVYGERGVKGENEDNNPGSKMAAEIEQQSVEISECELNPTDSAKYSIHVDVYKEILSTLRAGLALRPPKNSNQPIPRPITLLQCPKDGGSYYLDSVVEAIALKLRADLVRLDAQDIAQLVGPHLEENLAWNLSKTSLLGYEAHKVAGKLEEYYKEPSEHDEAEGAEEEEEAIAGMPKTSKALEDLKKRLASIFTRARPDSNRSNIPKVYGPYTVTNPIISLENALFNLYKDGQQGKLATSAGAQDGWDTLKVSALFETLTTATDLKRARNSDRVVGSEDDGSVDESRNIIIQLRDYKELSGTSEGAELIGRLRQAVNKRWQMGRNIILVGTTTEEAEPALSKPEIQHLQSDIVDGEKRTIMVPPDRREEQDIAFETDEKARMRTINVRHVSDMILKLVEGTQPLSLANIDLEKDLDSSTVFSAGLEDVVWTYARVHRVATTILGLGPILSNIDGTIFSKALKILSASDEVKFSWGAEESKEEDAEVEEVLNDIDTAQKKARDKLREIEKKCTRHEKKLLSGVVLPGNIRTTFGDIRAPEETVEALKTLTSLSLIRPEAFSYGVLATDKIPGLLLYGPPGTGKTLLAKAVAKESGATVLEVSAADLNDMFVGEAEKNVRALFTLAKKLSPCVVFIDEADAIFSTRGETKRASHRELINQFLREWDGINKNLHAFIILATNRPCKTYSPIECHFLYGRTQPRS
jgi:SpoVK/Ycf46/Vps4 family AAA+-type ATPase